MEQRNLGTMSIEITCGNLGLHGSIQDKGVEQGDDKPKTTDLEASTFTM